MPSKPEAFEKDFGYLWPFFDRVAASAGPDDAALPAAVADARAACERVAALLNGAQPPAPAHAAPTAQDAPSGAAAEGPDAAPPAGPAAAASAPPASPWTVGPLYVAPTRSRS